MLRLAPGHCAPDRHSRNGRPRSGATTPERGRLLIETRGTQAMTDSRDRLTLTRRTALVGALGTAALAATRPAFAQAGARKPNVLYIMADDLGYADLSCYGRRDYTTPVLDQLATQGMMFTHAYANSAVCTATRVALITGRYQYRLKVGLQEPLGGGDIGLPSSDEQ